MRFGVVGAGGHSREVADLIESCGHEIACFQDDALEGAHSPTGIPIHRSLERCDVDAVTIAIGDCGSRAGKFAELTELHPMTVLQHPTATVSGYASIGDGSQVMQNVVVNSTARVGANVILNVGCFVAHDCRVGAHCHIAPGVLMSGGSSVGNRSFIGAGAVLLPGVRVGNDCIVGAGAVVTHDVADGQTVVGIPARAVGER